MTMIYTRAVFVLALPILLSPSMVSAWYQFESIPDLEVSGTYQMESIFGEDPNEVISQRNELKFEIQYYDLIKTDWLKADFYAQFRPFYDTVYDMKGGMSANDELRKRWRTNYDWRSDERDPFMREIYLDVSAGNVDARLGRQIVGWGKSDGIFMLDIINPFNLRNPFKFEEEDIKIPLWMVNLNYRVGTDGNVQLLWMPKYQRLQAPGYTPAETEGGLNALLTGGKTGSERRRHAFEFKAFAFTNEYWQFENWAFSGFSDSQLAGNNQNFFPVRFDDPDGVGDSSVALRWSDQLGDVSYTLNYLYTWSAQVDFPNTPSGKFFAPNQLFTMVTRKPQRMHVIGGSWDMPLYWLPGPFKGLAWRGETAVFFNDLMINGDGASLEYFAPEKVTRHGLMMGFDQTYSIDLFPWIEDSYIDDSWFISLQYWQDWVVNAYKSDDAFLDFGAGVNWASDPLGVNPAGTRDAFKSQISLYILKDMLPGDVLHTEFFALFGMQQKDAWIRGRVRYEINDKTNVAVGFNKFVGGEFDYWGQFQDADHVFLEFRYVLF